MGSDEAGDSFCLLHDSPDGAWEDDDELFLVQRRDYPAVRDTCYTVLQRRVLDIRESYVGFDALWHSNPLHQVLPLHVREQHLFVRHVRVHCANVAIYGGKET